MGKTIENGRRKMFRLGSVELEQMKTFVLVLLTWLSLQSCQTLRNIEAGGFLVAVTQAT